MIRRTGKIDATPSTVAVWTPWGQQQALRPNERVESLRRLARHAAELRNDDKPKFSRRSNALAQG